MAVTYRVTVPFIDDMGSTAPFIVRQTYLETKHRAALWHINKMREHDGLRPLHRMPQGTTYERVN